jgi:hypothetical protein
MHGVIFCYIFQTVFIVYRWSPYYAGVGAEMPGGTVLLRPSPEAALTAVLGIHTRTVPKIEFLYSRKKELHGLSPNSYIRVFVSDL